MQMLSKHFSSPSPTRYTPVLTLGTLELTVERAGAWATRHRGGGRAGLAVQAQVDGGAHAALLQVDALRTPLVAQVGGHEQRVGE